MILSPYFVSMLSNEPMCLERSIPAPLPDAIEFQCSLTSRCVWNNAQHAAVGTPFQVSMLSNEPMCLERQQRSFRPWCRCVSMLSNEPMCLEVAVQRGHRPPAQFQCSLTSRCVWNLRLDVEEATP